MPDSKISNLNELAEAPATGDELVIVDKSDTSMAVTGTTKKITKANLVSAETARLDALEVVVNPASASAPASLDLHEDTDNGTNKITITAPSAVASDKVVTFQDATGEVVLKDTADTLTNKTLTSPVLSDAVPTADGAIGFDRTNEDFVVGDGAAGQLVHMGAWKSWTPSWTNLTIGNATVIAKYTKIGKTVSGFLKVTLGSTSSVGTNPLFILPVAFSSNNGNIPIGQIRFDDTGTANFYGALELEADGLKAQIVSMAVSGAQISASSVSATSPFTFATGDVIQIAFTYEAA